MPAPSDPPRAQVIQPEPIPNIDPFTLDAHVRVIDNFALQHLRAAAMFRDHLIVLERRNAGAPSDDFFEESRCYGSACIMSATACLEALINEFYIAHNSPLRNKFTDFETQFWAENGLWRKRTLDKYQTALKVLGIRRIDKQSATYKNAKALIGLRNTIVHFKPAWDDVRQSTVALVNELEGKFELSPFVDGKADFIGMRCMSAGCAEWAVATAYSFIHEFDSRARLDDNKMQGFWKLEWKPKPARRAR
jgi:hypothetical protein